MHVKFTLDFESHQQRNLQKENHNSNLDIKWNVNYRKIPKKKPLQI